MNEWNEAKAGQIGCETCCLTVESDGRLTHEDRCTIAIYREALADRDARIARLVEVLKGKHAKNCYEHMSGVVIRCVCGTDAALADAGAGKEPR